MESFSISWEGLTEDELACRPVFVVFANGTQIVSNENGYPISSEDGTAEFDLEFLVNCDVQHEGRIVFRDCSELNNSCLGEIFVPGKCSGCFTTFTRPQFTESNTCEISISSPTQTGCGSENKSTYTYNVSRSGQATSCNQFELYIDGTFYQNVTLDSNKITFDYACDQGAHTIYLRCADQNCTSNSLSFNAPAPNPVCSISLSQAENLPRGCDGENQNFLFRVISNDLPSGNVVSFYLDGVLRSTTNLTDENQIVGVSLPCDRELHELYAVAGGDSSCVSNTLTFTTPEYVGACQLTISDLKTHNCGESGAAAGNFILEFNYDYENSAGNIMAIYVDDEIVKQFIITGSGAGFATVELPCTGENSVVYAGFLDENVVATGCKSSSISFTSPNTSASVLEVQAHNVELEPCGNGNETKLNINALYLNQTTDEIELYINGELNQTFAYSSGTNAGSTNKTFSLTIPCTPGDFTFYIQAKGTATRSQIRTFEIPSCNIVLNEAFVSTCGSDGAPVGFVTVSVLAQLAYLITNQGTLRINGSDYISVNLESSEQLLKFSYPCDNSRNSLELVIPGQNCTSNVVYFQTPENEDSQCVYEDVKITDEDRCIDTGQYLRHYEVTYRDAPVPATLMVYRNNVLFREIPVTTKDGIKKFTITSDCGSGQVSLLWSIVRNGVSSTIAPIDNI